MVAAKASQRYNPAEYLALERRAEYKSEYIDGCIVAMAGASRVHGLIAFNLAGELHGQLRERPCEAFVGDMRVYIPATGRYTYPDTVIACADIQFEDAHLDTLLTPTVIFEVLSPSTEADDRGSKFAGYRSIPSLREYVLIAQDRPSVEHYLRQGEQWLLTAATDLDASVALPTIGCVLRLAEVYRRVRFPDPPVQA